MELTKTAQRVLAERYLIKDENGVPIEPPEELFHRVAMVVAEAEEKYEQGSSKEWVDKFEELMTSMKFLPNTPTLINAGRPLGQLSACFVLPVEDSMRGIFGAVTNAALIHQSGGGTGFSFSRVRPKGAKVSTTQGKASGPLSFMKVFNSATDCVKQGGTRRGANMGCLRIDHPDILEFIDCKLNLEEFNNFNLSVLVTASFMQALNHAWIDTPEAKEIIASAGDNFLAQVPKEYCLDANAHAFAYPLMHGGKLYGLMDSRYVWKKIVHNAWAMGEPGIIFIDRVNKYNPAKDIELIESTNPCLAGYTLILTKEGIFPIQELVGKEVEVWDGESWTKTIPQVTGYNKELFRITFSNGMSIDCTAEHKWPVCKSHGCPDSLPDGGHWEKIQTKDIRYGNWVQQYSPEGERVACCRIESIKPWKTVDKVYCMIVPTTHCFVANSILTGNCGEQPLLPYESCNLGSINLAKFVRPETHSLDMEALAETARLATRFLDNVIDVNKYPLPEIEEKTKQYRKIGLGIMGWADTLYLLGIPYESDEALALAEKVMECITDNSVKASMMLARKRGTFPAYDQVADAMWDMFGITEPVRNMTTTTIAPTGTLSIIAGVSSGIEPVFAPVMKRRILDDEEFIEVDSAFESVLDKWLSEQLYAFDEDSVTEKQNILESIIESGTAREVVPDKLAAILCCTKDISPEGHIRMQAAFQKHTHNAISKTVNLDNSATEDDVAEVYQLAYESGCKGVTVYRDGSRYNQVMNVAKDEAGDKSAEDLTTDEIVESADTTVDIPVSDEVQYMEGPAFPSVYEKDLREQLTNWFTKNHFLTITSRAELFSVIYPVLSRKASDKYPDKQDLEAIWQYLKDSVISTLHPTYDDVWAYKRLDYDGVDAILIALWRVHASTLEVAASYFKNGILVDKEGSKKFQKLWDMEHPCFSYVALDTPALQEAMGIKSATNAMQKPEGPNTKVHEKKPQMQDSAIESFVPIHSGQGYLIPRDREKKLHGETTQIRTGCGKLYITINRDKYGVAEIFTETGKGGGCPSQSEAVGRLASIALRAGVSPQEIIKQLRGIRCPSAIKRPDAECTSCPDAIAKLLQAAYKEPDTVPEVGSDAEHFCDGCSGSYSGECKGECEGSHGVAHKPSAGSNSVAKATKAKMVRAKAVDAPEDSEVLATSADRCECCGEPMAHEGGCKICYNCGNSHCG